MRRMFASLLVALAAVSATPVGAGPNMVVVELFTSQGCSSCPPADALLTKLAKRENVIALALHVDYWDYIGWKDNFGNPAYTARQKAYAQAARKRSIYTPQMIIGGTDHVVGHKPMDVIDLINAQNRKPTVVDLKVTRKGSKVQISAAMIGVPGKPMIVQLVRYAPTKTVKITRGENAGRTIEYANIVTDWQKIGQWNGSAPLEMVADASGDAPVVVIVQAAGPGQVLAAARLR